MADQASEPASSSVEQGSSFSMISFLTELLGSPLNLVLLGVCGVLLYKIFKGKKQDEPSTQREPELPPMKKRDFTLEQMREFDGRGPDGRVLLCVNGKVFDVTRGRRFYGPGKIQTDRASKRLSRFGALCGGLERIERHVQGMDRQMSLAC